MQSVDSSCFPPDFTSIFNSHYSPGVCPQGWISAASLGTDPKPPSTNIMCCPRGYFMSRKTFETNTKNPLDGGLFCASSIPDGATLTNVFTTTTLRPGATVPANQTPLAVARSGILDGLVWADIIQVQYGNADGGVIAIMREQSSSLTMSTTRSTTSPSPSQAQTSIPAETSPAAPAPASSGLSGGVIAGVVVGVLAGLILGGLAVWFMFKKRRQNREAGGEKPWGGRPDAELAAPAPSEMGGSPSTIPASAYTAGSPEFAHQKVSPGVYASAGHGYGHQHDPAPAYAHQPIPPFQQQAPAELPASGPTPWKN